jgi:hypothetical protein
MNRLSNYAGYPQNMHKFEERWKLRPVTFIVHLKMKHVRFECDIYRIKGILFSILSLSGPWSGEPDRVSQMMLLIKTVVKTNSPLFCLSVIYIQKSLKQWSWSYGSWIYSYLCNRQTKVVISNHVHGKVYSIQHYVIKFVSDLRQVHNIFFLKNAYIGSKYYVISESCLNIHWHDIHLCYILVTMTCFKLVSMSDIFLI